MEVEQGLVLVSGPSRSGKSRWAETLLEHQDAVTYVATAARREHDASWQERLRLHRERRPAHWSLVEAEANLPALITDIDPDHHLLIDALGGYVAWCLELDHEQWQHACQQLTKSLTMRQRAAVVVIEETGWGVVPPTAIGVSFAIDWVLLPSLWSSTASEVGSWSRAELLICMPLGYRYDLA